MINDDLYDRLSSLVAQTSLEISSKQKQQLVGYVQLLHKWNKTYNLTSVRDPQEMLIKHIMDSLMVQPYFDAKRCIDVGTGPGLPGIPLAITQPQMHFTLLDSLGKRIRFIKQALFELKIDNVDAVQSRVELFQPDEKYDVVISRAFASMKDMLHWCQHLPKEETGVYFALKGQVKEQELSDLPENVSVKKIHLLSVPELGGERHLVVLFHKISE